MALLQELFGNRVLAAAVLGWFFAQSAKVAITFLLTRSFRPERFWGAGGMPSAHSAMVSALTIAMARFDGVNSSTFALAIVFAFVTMYDAMGVRREAGEHARVLNKYINRIEKKDADTDGDGVPDKKFDVLDLKELIGHTPLEVLGGVLMGIVVGITIPG